MKKVAAAMVVLLIVGASVGAMLITENAGLVGAALTELKFEAIPGNPKLIGAPPNFNVTKATIEYLQKLLKDGKIVEVQNDGALKIK